MSKLNRSNKRGFSLVELIIAVALGIFILTSGILVLTNIFSSSSSFSQRQRVNQKLDSIIEQIRYQAIGNFSSMTEVNQPRSSTLYPDISVFSTISDVDPVSKTRRATLRAEYWVGRGANRTIQTSTKTFNFGDVYSVGTGASIKIRVVDIANPSIGVPGIRVETLGEGTPVVVGTTDPNGDVTVFGVKDSSVNIRVDVKTFFSRAYFPGTPPTFVKSFFPTINGAQTQAGGAPVLFPDAEVALPGSLRGVVLDAGDNNPPIDPVVGMTVRAIPVTVPPNNTGTPLEPDVRTTITSPLGQFEFSALIPGDYYVIVYGDHNGFGDDWVGVDVPGSSDTIRLRSLNGWGTGNRFPGVYSVNPSAVTDVGTLYTVRKSVVTGNVQVLNSRPGVPNRTFGVSPYLYEASPQTPVRLFSDRDKTYSDQPISAPAPNNYLPPGVFRWRAFNGFGFTHSYSHLGYEFFLAHNSQYGYEEFTSGSGLAAPFIFENVWPIVVYRDHAANNMEQQFSIALPYRHSMPNISNAAPVTVAEKPGTNELTFYIQSRTWDEITLPRSSGTSNTKDTTDFEFPIYTDGNQFRNQGRIISFLKRHNDVFATATGVIRTMGAMSSHWVEVSIDAQFATQPGSPTTLLGCGLLTYNPWMTQPGWVIDARHRIFLTANSSTDPNATYPFSLTESGQNMIVPTLGTDRQTFLARFLSNPVPVATNFNSVVLGYTKRLQGGNTSYTVLTPSEVNIGDFHFRATAQGNPPRTISLMVPNGISAGVMNFNVNSGSNRAEWTETRELLLGPTTYAPGETVDFGTTDLTLSTQVARVYDVTLATASGSNPYWSYVGSTWSQSRRFFGTLTGGSPPTGANFQPENPSSGDPHYIPTFVRTPQFRISGTVRRASDNTPVVSAQVEISGIFLSTITVVTNGAGFFTTGASYLSTIPTPNQDDIWVTVTPLSPLQPRYTSFQIYENSINTPMPDVILNFLLSETQGGYGTGGSG